MRKMIAIIAATGFIGLTPLSPVIAQPAMREAGPEEYFFDVSKLPTMDAGRGYTDATGQVVKGQRMMGGVVRLKAGRSVQAQTHSNEQWIYVLEGEFISEVGGKTYHARPGSMIYIPSNAVNAAKALPNADVVIFTIKDTSHGLWGTKVEK